MTSTTTDDQQSNDFSIIPATPEDIPSILTFIRELAEYEKLLHTVETTEELLKKSLFPSRKEHGDVFAALGPFCHVLMAKETESGEAVGFALYFYNFSTFTGRPGVYLEDLYVTPSKRGLGLGARFFNELAKIALQVDGTRMEWSVLDWNEPARGFYRKVGAKELMEWVHCRVERAGIEKLAQ